MRAPSCDAPPPPPQRPDLSKSPQVPANGGRRSRSAAVARASVARGVVSPASASNSLASTGTKDFMLVLAEKGGNSTSYVSRAGGSPMFADFFFRLRSHALGERCRRFHRDFESSTFSDQGRQESKLDYNVSHFDTPIISPACWTRFREPCILKRSQR